MKWDVLNKEGKVAGSVDLDDAIVKGPIYQALLAESIKIYRGNQRQGTADTKERSEISKSNRKPWKQKGTGRARSGRASSPIWRGGGTIFGPTPHSYYRIIPRKVKKLACTSAVRTMVRDKTLRIIDELNFTKPSAAAFQTIVDQLQISSRSLIVVHKLEDNLMKSVRNADAMVVKESKNVNALDLLLPDHVVFTKQAVLELVDRLKKPVLRKKVKQKTSAA